MNRFQKRIIGITSAIASLTFAMITAAVGTVAWFVASARQQANGMSVEAGSPDVSLSYDIYKYDFNNNVGVKYHNDATKFNLPKYSALLNEENIPQNNVIIKIDVAIDNFDATNKEIQLSFTYSGDYPYYNGDTNEVQPATSNIAEFKVFPHEYLPHGLDASVDSNWVNLSGVISRGSEGTDDYVYSQATDVFETIETPTTFVSVNGNTYQKSSNTKPIIITPYLPSTDDSGSSIKMDIVSFFVEVSYNDRLMENYLSSHESDMSEGDMSFCNLNGDISKIQIKTNDNTNGTSNTGKYVRLASNYNAIDANYLAVYRENDSATMGKVFDGSASTLANLGTPIDAKIQDNSIVADKNNNAASLKFESTGDPRRGTLSTSKYRKNTTGGYIYADSNRQPIGSRDNTTETRREAVNYENELNVTQTGYGQVTCVSNGVVEHQNPTNLWYNSNANKFNYYKGTQASNYKDIELFRYTENAQSLGTLVDLQIGPIQDKNFYKYYSSQEFRRFRTVYAVYSDGGRFDVTDLVTYSIVGHEDEEINDVIRNTSGSSQVTYSVVADYYEYNNIHATHEYSIYVTPVAISDIEIDGPTVTTFYAYDEPNYSGLRARYKYNDGSTSEYIEYGDPSLKIINNHLINGKWPDVKTPQTFYYSVYLDNLSDKAKNVTVTINPLVISLIAPSPATVKVGQQATISVSSSSKLQGKNVVWSYEPSNLIETSPSESNSGTTITAKAEGTLRVTATIQNTTYSTYVDLTIKTEAVYTKVDFDEDDFVDQGEIGDGAYILVYEDGNTGYVFNGVSFSSSASNTVSYTITRNSKNRNQIVVDDQLSEELQFTTENNTIYAKNSNNKYITYSGLTSNYGMNFSDSKATIGPITWYDDGTVNFGYTNNTSNYGMYCYISSSGAQHTFEYSKNLSVSKVNISVYRFTQNKSSVKFDDTETNFIKNHELSIPVTFISGTDGKTTNDLVWKVDGLIVTNCYSDGCFKYIPTTKGDHTITAGFDSSTAEATIKINAGILSSISITTEPTKTFKVGDTFSFENGKVTASYSNGLSNDVTSSITTNYDGKTFATADIGSSKPVTVTYRDPLDSAQTATTTYNIEVKENTGTLTTKEYSFVSGSSSVITDWSSWGSSYTGHTVSTSECTIVFSSANKQSGTITNMPVTKGQPITVQLTLSGKALKSFIFECAQWSDKKQTISWQYSTDGSNWSNVVGTDPNFTLSGNVTASNVKWLKFTFSSSSNQVGIKKLTISYM